MKRRQFLLNASLASVAGVALFPILNGCAETGKNNEVKDQTSAENFSLEEATIDQLQALMQSGKMSARAITEMYLKRIDDIDKNQYGLNSVIEINPDALSIADQLDKERLDKKVRGPLHGIPVLIKDNIDTGDRMMTTAGSLALSGHVSREDAFIIGELRKAGAVLLGKTNLSEWANFRSTRSSSGWSSRGGQTKNPYVLDRSPCGSSSGSGTAVAANLCAVAIGTETNGSIACPASTNGIVGIKPTVGLWSRSGIIPISNSQDTAGPMARTVKDAAILLGALTAQDQTDSTTLGSRGKVQTDYTAFLKTDLAGRTIGVEKTFLKAHEAVDKLLQDALEVLRSKGARIEEVDLVNNLKSIEGPEFDLLKFEFKDGLNKYLAASNTPVKSLQEVIEFNRKNEEKVMPYFKQEILIDSESKPGLDSKEYKALYANVITGTRSIIAEIFKKHNLDAICGPTNGPSWCIDLVNGDFFTGYGMYSPAAIAGFPSVTVPMGAVLGLPIGLTFIGLAFTEGDLINIAFAYEQASHKRVAPQFKKSSTS